LYKLQLDNVAGEYIALSDLEMLLGEQARLRCSTTPGLKATPMFTGSELQQLCAQLNEELGNDSKSGTDIVDRERHYLAETRFSRFWEESQKLLAIVEKFGDWFRSGLVYILSDAAAAAVLHQFQHHHYPHLSFFANPKGMTSPIRSSSMSPGITSPPQSQISVQRVGLFSVQPSGSMKFHFCDGNGIVTVWEFCDMDRAFVASQVLLPSRVVHILSKPPPTGAPVNNTGVPKTPMTQQQQQQQQGSPPVGHLQQSIAVDEFMSRFCHGQGFFKRDGNSSPPITSKDGAALLSSLSVNSTRGNNTQAPSGQVIQSANLLVGGGGAGRSSLSMMQSPLTPTASTAAAPPLNSLILSSPEALAMLQEGSTPGGSSAPAMELLQQIESLVEKILGGRNRRMRHTPLSSMSTSSSLSSLSSGGTAKPQSIVNRMQRVVDSLHQIVKLDGAADHHLFDLGSPPLSGAVSSMRHTPGVSTPVLMYNHSQMHNLFTNNVDEDITMETVTAAVLNGVGGGMHSGSLDLTSTPIQQFLNRNRPQATPSPLRLATPNL
jgi:hypothetical protein